MRTYFFWLLAFIVASVFSLTAQPAFADPANDLAAVKNAFQNVSSVHIEFKSAERSGSLDMINPGKLHWTLSNGIQIIVIGQQSWMNMGGRWIQRPQAGQMAQTMMQRFRTLDLEGSDIRKNYKITDAGMTTVAGAPAHKYHIVKKENGHTLDLFVGANHLPIQSVGADGDTWTFSQYNSVADIKPPM
jgi:hypothetical protein